MLDSAASSVYGSHDAGWLAHYEFFREALGLRVQTDPLRGLTDLARSAGWALPHADICWVSERHNILRRDAAGRLHDVTGPAVAYPDGWAIYAVHGVRVPEEWITAREKLDVKTALTWANVEQRRAAAELIGWDRVIKELKPRVIDEGATRQIGTLLEVDLPDAPKTRFLRAQCGTGRTVVVLASPEARTALEAGAMSYGITTDEYVLEVRT